MLVIISEVENKLKLFAVQVASKAVGVWCVELEHGKCTSSKHMMHHMTHHMTIT